MPVQEVPVREMLEALRITIGHLEGAIPVHRMSRERRVEILKAIVEMLEPRPSPPGSLPSMQVKK